MLTIETANGYLKEVKRHLNITWEDDDTDKKLIEQMLDAEYALNHKLGAEADYFSAGQERRLYLSYMLYSWNDCLDEFDRAYMGEIYQLRRKYEVAQYKEEQEDEPET